MAIKRPASRSVKQVVCVKRRRTFKVTSVPSDHDQPPELNWVIVYALRAYLEVNKDQDVSSILTRVSKRFYTLFEPLISYHLYITEVEPQRVSWRLSTGILEEERPLPQIKVTPEFDSPNQVTIQQRLDRIRRTTDLSIQDIPSLKAFCNIIINQETSTTKIDSETFTNVTHLTLGHNLTRHLGLTFDGKYYNLLTTLEMSLGPIHLCMDYSSSMDKIGFNDRIYQNIPPTEDQDQPYRTELEWEQDKDEIWEYTWKSGVTNVVVALMTSWDLVQVTLLTTSLTVFYTNSNKSVLSLPSEWRHTLTSRSRSSTWFQSLEDSDAP